MQWRIVVTRSIPEAALEELRSVGEVHVCEQDRPLRAEELHEAVRGAHAIVSMVHDRIDGAVVDAAGPQLRVVANVAVGYDNVDVDALAQRDIAVTNTPGVLADATADLAFGLLLMLTRRLGEGERLLRSRTPWSWHMSFMLGTGLQGKTLGVVGLGRIGQAVAHRARAFGMEITYTGRNRVDPDVETALGARYVSLEQLLDEADAVSLHCPLTEATRHLVDETALERMKSSAVLVNTSRGPVVDEQALARALGRRSIAGAALDVFEHEPTVQPDLLDLDNVVVVPHLGSATTETRTAMAVLAARNVTGVLAGAGAHTPIGA
ncbi:lactate dehydrogenase-like 2-hydroxyacid dehydrogenase [Halopolyspora algeriensis]|uniref:Lactate dehydrogenase-like 2-hydroxyacid dehydrogenase n=1 Tax=Halopolyspora algeriensis TaxID=1500506 RepID=A0A368VPV7_9ACTN|nr:D-glycerate dehydrogenase [Halopolyspora algeriensis]RCW43891.1 lactate dehydrogenase-like 2-hydroxyacid dehydrogenase [Halopolyspora algeriensis]TQM53606.1 lactate dehydrogenase-like 2-hydroxyacid dehydrogenase [Halopolyspora algeriensis]